MKPWLEYHLEALEFFNGAKLGFSSARMLYNTEENIIALDQLDSSPRDIEASLHEIANPDGTLPDIKTIFYEMRFHGYPPMAFFYHPIGHGAGIRLLPQDQDGRTRLFFMQQNGRPMFSKDYTVRDVTRGEIDSDQAVWQFHGYKHEH